MSRVILGVDPGLTRCGVAVINSGSARKVSLVHVDTLKSSPSTDLSERLAFIADGVEALIVEHKPSVIAIERVFSHKQAVLKKFLSVKIILVVHIKPKLRNLHNKG